ncbi:MFS transporter [Rufibacter glacialis]|uniref:MFS transporter n=1 Tax=Rufibacter glacialis TaxID=1259555 RepID=A0A5M8QLC2_9BACT|nr:MFS transporter [Rufibacter glacialis]KAA6435453.1 MFS transporter [Rufibacter glacialis]GGK63573.1 MFS transporter [Rufibacter glacialis]
MTRILSLYRNAFGGLSREAWLLAAVMFINRSGAMVVPFLSVYLTEALGFTLQQVGLLLSLFGVGSMCGTFLGGWLTDKVGHFKVQFLSLVLGGSWFFVMLTLERFEFFAGGIFLLSLLTECLRPANASSVSSYARPENVTRAFSLNRMAINLGFSIGPALGGLLATVSYQWLFMADGITCLTAGVLFFFYFRHRQGHAPTPTPPAQAELPSTEPVRRSPYQDGLFLVFTVLCCCYAVAFFQFFSTMPLYFRQVYQLSELQIGGLLAFNGLMVFLLEMIIVYLLGERHAVWKMIVLGLLLLAMAFVLLNVAQGFPVLVLSVLLMSLSEMLAMPFMSTLTVQRSGPHNRGSYMGLYSLSYSGAHIIGPYVGTSTIASYGFDTLWWGASILCVVAALGFYVVVKRLQKS